MNRFRLVAVVLLVVCPAFLRVTTVEWNVVPIGALALFCGTRFRSRTLAFGVPLSAMLLGDVLLGFARHNMSLYLFHADLPFVYGAYAISVGMGIFLRGRWDRAESRVPAGDGDARVAEARAPRSLIATYAIPAATYTLAGSVIFFLVSNFGMWWLFNTYEKSWRGLFECYMAAVPFFRHTLSGDVCGSAVLFTGDYLLRLNAAPLPESERL